MRERERLTDAVALLLSCLLCIEVGFDCVVTATHNGQWVLGFGSIHCSAISLRSMLLGGISKLLNLDIK